MLKRILIGLSLVLMLGFFSIGCEPPPENGDNGQQQGYEQQEQEQGQLGQQNDDGMN
ncbi:MAG: hypothetical protein R6V41_05680 [Desulfobacteraceae bacterium]